MSGRIEDIITAIEELRERLKAVREIQAQGRNLETWSQIHSLLAEWKALRAAAEQEFLARLRTDPEAIEWQRKQIEAELKDAGLLHPIWALEAFDPSGRPN